MVQRIHVQGLVVFAVLCFVFAVALPAFARSESRGSTASSTSEIRRGHSSTTAEIRKFNKRKGAKNVNASCMQAAVEVRETALGTAFGDFHDDIDAGLAARKTALNTAWGMSSSTDRGKAIRSAWETWKKTHRDGFKVFKDARKSAWDTFKNTVKTSCKESLPADEKLGGDEAGSMAI